MRLLTGIRTLERRSHPRGRQPAWRFVLACALALPGLAFSAPAAAEDQRDFLSVYAASNF